MGKQEGMSNPEKRVVHDVWVKDKQQVKPLGQSLLFATSCLFLLSFVVAILLLLV